LLPRRARRPSATLSHQVTVTGFLSLGGLNLVPPTGSASRHPLPSTGFSRTAFPGFTGTMRCSESLTSYPPRFVFLHVTVTTPGACVRDSDRIRRRFGGRGFSGLATPCSQDFTEVETQGRPKFLGNPDVPMPCSRTPAGPHHQVIRWFGMAPAHSTARAPTTLHFGAQ